jgi:hypothetical protein
MGICVSAVLFFVSGAAIGQVVSEPNYEVAIHILMGSNEAGAKADLPSSLSGLSQQLKTKVGYSNFRLAGTIIGRMANQGVFEYKSTSNLFGLNPTVRSFLELTLNDLRPGSVAGTLKFDAFRFSARVPMATGYRKDESGKDQPIIQYEQLGLTLRRIALSENVSTLIGTLDVPNGNDMIFLVMTVKPLDR